MKFAEHGVSPPYPLLIAPHWLAKYLYLWNAPFVRQPENYFVNLFINVSSLTILKESYENSFMFDYGLFAAGGLPSATCENCIAVVL
ncbi:hypothetical protein [Simonsiella muelleri]|uniref:hypothetical protein n=1 Tax=Simonsiella muelleri TaxID=72 RepID=UPI0023F0A98F|nr:hypothetical protein [Simonsiella muelleri]